jgi:PAS domain S-box-containing protein
LFFTAPSDAVERVTLQLKWTHQFQFAGYYAAIEKRFYRQEGLDVTLIEGKPGENEIEGVISGKADFGVGMSDVFLARVKGKPVVVLANIFQHSPSILLTLKDSGISSPKNLFGQKVMMALGYKSAELQAMFLNEGVPVNELTILKPSWNLDDLINGRVAAMAAYISSAPYFLKKMNIPYIIFPPRLCGIDFYGDNLFTSEQEISQHPNRVRAFRKASLKGWQYALEHPEEVIDIILRKYTIGRKDLTKEFLVNEAASYEKLILPEVVKIGHMNPGRWKHIAEIYVKLGMADKDYSLKGLLYDPISAKFYWGHWAVKWGTGIFITVFTITLFLFFFNRRLKREIFERKRTEKKLQKLHDSLEEQVTERTVKLVSINKQLEKEINARRQVEKELRASKEKFSSIFRMSPVGIIISTLDDGKIINANESAEKITGFTIQKTVGRTSVDIGFWKNPEVRKRVVHKFKKSGRIRNFKFEFENKSGQTRLGLCSLEPISINKVSCIITIIHDITEIKIAQKALKDSKQMLEALFDGIYDPLVLVTRDMKILKLNKAALSYYGVKFKDAVNSYCYEVLKGQYTPCENCRLTSAVSDKTGISFERKGCLHPERDEEVTTYPVMDSSIEIGTLVRISDITEEKKKKEFMARAGRLSFLGQVSGRIAHEIRNPLGAIKLFLDILNDGDTYKRSRMEMEIFDDININIDKINGIIKRILNFANPGIIHFENLDVNEVIKESLEFFISKIDNLNITLKLSLDHSISTIKGDKISLQQVITNLILNAIQAMGNGGSLCIRTMTDNSDFHMGQGLIVITIKDTGTGIKPEDEETIFNPFFTTKPTGTGLGLAISDQIIEHHGGTISFTSIPGEGSTFCIELPGIKET